MARYADILVYGMAYPSNSSLTEMACMAGHAAWHVTGLAAWAGMARMARSIYDPCQHDTYDTYGPNMTRMARMARPGS